MHPRLQRALMLLNQSRFEQAEQELRQALLQMPNDSTLHGALAICLAERERYDEAGQEAANAIGLSPDLPFAFYAQAIVQRKRNRFKEAEQAIGQAIQLAPDDADYFALLGQLQLDQRQWTQALASANQGLSLEADNTSCANVRAMALVMTGQKTNAENTIKAALARNPENATTHANMGWTLLEKGQIKEAMVHFREALRLEPNYEWARLGIVEALKARRFPYGLVLKYFLWVSKLQQRTQWGIVVGGYFAYQAMLRVARTNPAAAPYLMPFIVAYIVWACSTWMASPLFNLTLLVDPFGRYALSREEKITGFFVGACVLGVIASLGVWAVTGLDVGLVGAVVCGLMIPPLSRIYSCETGWPRTTMILITAGLALLGYAAIMGTLFGANTDEGPRKLLLALGIICFWAFIAGAIGSQLAANALAGVRPRH